MDIASPASGTPTPYETESSAADMLDETAIVTQTSTSRKRKKTNDVHAAAPPTANFDKDSIVRMLSDQLNLSKNEDTNDLDCKFLLLFPDPQLLLSLFQEVQKVLEAGVPLIICDDCIKIQSIKNDNGIPVDARLFCKVLVQPVRDVIADVVQDYLICVRPADIVPDLSSWNPSNPVCFYSLDGCNAHLLSFQTNESENIPITGTNLPLIAISPEEDELSRLPQLYSMNMPRAEMTEFLKLASKKHAFVLKFTIKHEGEPGDTTLKPKCIVVSIETEKEQPDGSGNWKNFLMPTNCGSEGEPTVLEYGQLDKNFRVHYEERFFVQDFKHVIDHMKQTHMQLTFSETCLVISHAIGQDGSKIRMVLMCRNDPQ